MDQRPLQQPQTPSPPRKGKLALPPLPQELPTPARTPGADVSTHETPTAPHHAAAGSLQHPEVQQRHDGVFGTPTPHMPAAQAEHQHPAQQYGSHGYFSGAPTSRAPAAHPHLNPPPKNYDSLFNNQATNPTAPSIFNTTLPYPPPTTAPLWQEGQKVKIAHTCEPVETRDLMYFKRGTYRYTSKTAGFVPQVKVMIPVKGGMEEVWRCGKGAHCTYCVETAPKPARAEPVVQPQPQMQQVQQYHQQQQRGGGFVPGDGMIAGDWGAFGVGPAGFAPPAQPGYMPYYGGAPHYDEGAYGMQQPAMTPQPAPPPTLVQNPAFNQRPIGEPVRTAEVNHPTTPPPASGRVHFSFDLDQLTPEKRGLALLLHEHYQKLQGESGGPEQQVTPGPEADGMLQANPASMNEEKPHEEGGDGTAFFDFERLNPENGDVMWDFGN